MAKSWYSISARAASADVYILDEIGAFGVTAKTFIDDLGAIGGKPFVLHVNSPGGDMFEATAIHNAIDTYPANVTGVVEGVAASAGSFVLMAADRIVMPANSMMMIHEASVGVVGGVEDMNEASRLLAALNKNMANAYAARSGMAVEQIAALMAATSWFTAEEAMALGFADEVRPAVRVAASFDLSKWPNAPDPQTAPKTIDDVSARFWATKGK